MVFDEADTLCDTFYEKEAARCCSWIAAVCEDCISLESCNRKLGEDSSKLLQGLEEDCPTKPQAPES